MGIDDDMRREAELQHGLLATAQARAMGASRAALRHRSGGSDWELLTRRVLRLVGSARTAEQRLMAAVLDAGPGAVASHRAAAALWRLPGFPFGPEETSRPRGTSTRRPEVGRLHQPRHLPATHGTVIRGIPVTTLPRTIFDPAACVHPARIERVLDSVVSSSPAVLGVLHGVLEQLGERGRHGTTVIRSLLAERPTGSAPPASGLEARFQGLLAAAGQPPLQRPVDVGGHDWIGRVDFADVRLGLLVEVDSDTFHSGRLDHERDRRRDRALLEAGWRRVLRVSEHQIWRRPDEAVELVRDARRRLESVLAAEMAALAADPAARTERGAAQVPLPGRMR